MAPEKCIVDPSRDCLGLAKAEMLENQIAEYRQQSRETHSVELMSTEIIVSVISLLGTIVGSLGGVFSFQPADHLPDSKNSKKKWLSTIT